MDDLFPHLDPPPGGLSRLHARIRRPASPHWVWPVATTGALVLATALLFVWMSDPPPSPFEQALMAQLSPPTAAVPTDAHHTDALEVSSGTNGVLFIRVASIREKTP